MFGSALFDLNVFYVIWLYFQLFRKNFCALFLLFWCWGSAGVYNSCLLWPSLTRWFRASSGILGQAASAADHLEMSNSNTAKCFSAVETLATRYAAIPSRIHVWDHWYARPAEPVTVVPPPPSAPPPVADPELAPPTAPMGAPSGSSGGGFVLPFSVHPSHDCIYLPNACPDSGWPRGGGGT